ncbi:MAG: response regulator [Bacteroidales bacterium]|nr:response regulator [Bacteroidales bacterium]
MIEQTFFTTRTNVQEVKKIEEQDFDWSDKTILIAEDEEVNYIYLKTALSKTNVNIVRAYNGEEAVDIARVNPLVELILMDIKMPKMNGLEATKAIKSFRSDLVIVAQTAFAMEEDRKNCEAVGVDDFLSKPVRYKLLFETLSRHLK